MISSAADRGVPSDQHVAVQRTDPDAAFVAVSAALTPVSTTVSTRDSAAIDPYVPSNQQYTGHGGVRSSSQQGLHDDDDVQQPGSTARCCTPCATLNGNVSTFYRCSREARRFPWVCQWGPDWPCNLVLFLLLLGPSLPFLALVAPSLHWAVPLTGTILLLFSLGSLCATALSDPGYLPKLTKQQMEVERRRMEEEGLSGTFTVCQYCNVIRVQATTHCYDCNACVLELDHHCPWMSKCVAKNNLVPFYTFLWSILALIVFTAASFFAWVVTKTTNAPAGQL